MTIQDVVTARGIKVLFHFTRIQNLAPILTHGLMPRGLCAANGIVPAINDQYRLDQTDGVCMTISFPNYKMFYPLRQENLGVEWAVLALRPSILWEKDVAFCRANAAKNEVTAIPLNQRKGVAALESMFIDYNEIPRSGLQIPTCYPTNPQAEVLVFDRIGPEYIFGVAFDKQSNLDQCKGLGFGNTFQFIKSTSYFYPRSDHAHWK